MSDVGSGMWVSFALGAGAILVDLERVDSPVAFSECRRVVLHIRFAAAALRRACAGGKGLAGPVTTESNIKDLKNQKILVKMIIY